MLNLTIEIVHAGLFVIFIGYKLIRLLSAIKMGAS